MRQQEDAPGVALVLGLKDSMMDPRRVIESLNSANDVDCIHITNTKHGIHGSKKVMDDILQLFPWMDQIKARRKAGEDVGSLVERVSFAEDVSEIDRQGILELVEQLEAKK